MPRRFPIAQLVDPLLVLENFKKLLWVRASSLCSSNQFEELDLNRIGTDQTGSFGFNYLLPLLIPLSNLTNDPQEDLEAREEEGVYRLLMRQMHEPHQPIILLLLSIATSPFFDGKHPMNFCVHSLDNAACHCFSRLVSRGI